MKQAKILLVFIVVFAMLFAACGNSSVDAEAEEVLVSVDYATDEILSKYDSYDEYIEFEDENYQKIVFSTNVAAKDFKFIEIGLEEDSEDITFFEKEVLYTLEELSAEKSFIVTWMEWGAIPHRGISYIDETGTTRYFCIVMSGEDGSLYLDEF